MSYNNRAHEIELRQKIANLERDKEGVNEVAIACDILAACHPSEYLNALVRNYKRLLTSYEAAGGIFKQFQEEHSILIGEKIPEENFDEKPQNDSISLARVFSQAFDTLENRDGDDINNILEKEIEIPDFLK